MSATSHEDFSREVSRRGPSDRSFGLVFAGFFTLVACWPLLRHGPVRIWALAVGGLFLVVTALRPALLAPLNRYWMRLGLLLNRIVNPLVTGVLFLLVITPIAVLVRRKKDPLRLRWDPQADSYWVGRQKGSSPVDSMANQF